jgi:hypothetical protein
MHVDKHERDSLIHDLMMVGQPTLPMRSAAAPGWLLPLPT